MNTKARIIIGTLSAALLLLGCLFLFALGYHAGTNSTSLTSQAGRTENGPQVQFRQNSASSPAQVTQTGEHATIFKPDPNGELETARKNLNALEKAALNQ